MQKQKHKPLGFRQETEYSNGYEIEVFTIYTDLRFDLIDSVIVGTLENAAGYGSLEAAEHIQRRSILLKSEGFTRVCRWGFNSFRIMLQRYGKDEPNSYCDPSLENLGRRPAVIREQLQICDRLVKVSGVNFDQISTPDLLVFALNRIKATRVEYKYEWLVPAQEGKG